VHRLQINQINLLDGNVKRNSQLTGIVCAHQIAIENDIVRRRRWSGLGKRTPRGAALVVTVRQLRSVRRAAVKRTVVRSVQTVAQKHVLVETVVHGDGVIICGVRHGVGALGGDRGNALGTAVEKTPAAGRKSVVIAMLQHHLLLLLHMKGLRDLQMLLLVVHMWQVLRRHLWQRLGHRLAP